MADGFLHGPGVIEGDAGPRPVPTVRTGVIGLVGTPEGGPFDQATLVRGLDEGADVFRGGTLGDSFDAIYGQIGAIVVAVRVEPTGLQDHAEREIEAAAGGPWNIGRTDVDRVVVKSEDGNTEYDLVDDYTLDKAKGVVTRKAGGAIAANVTKLRISFAARVQVAARAFPVRAGVVRLDAEGRPKDVEVRSADAATLYVRRQSR